MKRTIAIGLVLFTCAVGTACLAQCPEEPNDRGECDSLYVEPWPPDLHLDLMGGPPYFLRVPLLVTHDVPDPTLDSLAGFIVPLTFTHSNPAKYCSTSDYWNTTHMFYVFPDFSTRSIFRHLVSESDPSDTIRHNRLATMASDFSGREWDTAILNVISGTDFWLAVIATGTTDQKWWEGSRVLLATMTFKLEDTMTVCIDSTFWPPNGRLLFADFYGTVFIPRHNLPVCFHATSANLPPNSFALLFPPNDASTPRRIPLDWETTTDPDPGDQVKYDLYLSTSSNFSPDSTTVDSNLTTSEYLKTLDYGTYYWKVKAKDGRGAQRWSNETWRFMVTGLPQLTVGDFNSDGSVDVGDVVFAINYLYRSGPPPNPIEAGDVNCDGTVDVGDVVYLVNYLFRGGPSPCEP